MSIIPHIHNVFQRGYRSTVGRGWLSAGLLSVTAFSLISMVAACSPAVAGAPPAQKEAYTVYRFNPFEENQLVPLDPETLDDQPEGRTLGPGLFSADGSTRVDLEYPPGRNVNDPNLRPDQVWIVVSDLQSGIERRRFHPPVSGLATTLSEDGTRLVIEPFPPSRYPPIADWYVIETAGGEVATHIKDEGMSCFRGTGIFDPAVRKRVYCTVDPEITGADGPEPMQLVAYDLESGDRVDQIELPEVLIGGREGERTVNDQPVWLFVEPALALSPDGRQLAVVHAGADQVTLLETDPLTVERSIALKQHTGLLDWFAPALAHAKGEMEGVIRQVVFSVDGQHLYIFSQEFGEEASDRRGLWLVDLTEGDIAAEALPEFQIQWVRPAPDGSVYVFGTLEKGPMMPFEIRPDSPSTLWRLDALTLEILAQREFTGYQGGRLVPAQPFK